MTLEEATKEDYSTLSLDEMEARNTERFQQLANQGLQVNPGAGYLETLIESLLDEDRLLEARETYQRKLGKELDNLESQVLRMRLGVR
jgi:hypothetical protein